MWGRKQPLPQKDERLSGVSVLRESQQRGGSNERSVCAVFPCVRSTPAQPEVPAAAVRVPVAQAPCPCPHVSPVPAVTTSGTATTAASAATTSSAITGAAATAAESGRSGTASAATATRTTAANTNPPAGQCRAAPLCARGGMAAPSDTQPWAGGTPCDGGRRARGGALAQGVKEGLSWAQPPSRAPS